MNEEKNFATLMNFATLVIIEDGVKMRTWKPKTPLTIHEVGEIFYKILGRRCDVSLSKGTARVSCDRRKKEREPWLESSELTEEIFFQ